MEGGLFLERLPEGLFNPLCRLGVDDDPANEICELLLQGVLRDVLPLARLAAVRAVVVDVTLLLELAHDAAAAATTLHQATEGKLPALLPPVA
ncbi:MAG: hypothetical protein O7H41_21730 [Planctomycetota bacterium]|nr:hypothetical protein [Planctomycetota bacterium]